MKFNASKCYVLRITNKKKPVLHSYTMHDQILENVDQKPYLGVQFTNTLKWDTHLNSILAKANKPLIAWLSCFVVLYNRGCLSLPDDEKLCETIIVF
jgi:hypothetical protein